MRKLDSALFDAVKENNTSAVLKLLERGANPNAYEAVILRGYEKCRRNPLHVALRATDDRGFGVDVPENTAMIWSSFSAHKTLSSPYFIFQI